MCMGNSGGVGGTRSRLTAVGGVTIGSSCTYRKSMP